MRVGISDKVLIRSVKVVLLYVLLQLLELVSKEWVIRWEEVCSVLLLLEEALLSVLGWEGDLLLSFPVLVDNVGSVLERALGVIFQGARCALLVVRDANYVLNLVEGAGRRQWRTLGFTILRRFFSE